MFFNFNKKSDAFKAGIQFQVDDNFQYKDASFKLNSGGYAMFSSAKEGLNAKLLHRILMNAPIGSYIDHIDGDRCNNKLENLRFCTLKQNAANRKKTKKNTSGYKGVWYDTHHTKWRAEINHKKLGYFDTPELAYAAYCAKAIELNGEFANFG